MALFQWIQVSAKLQERSGVSSRTGQPYTIYNQRCAVYTADEPDMPQSTFLAQVRDPSDKLDPDKKYGLDLTCISNGDYDRPTLGNLTLYVIDEGTGLPADLTSVEIVDKPQSLSDRAAPKAPKVA